MDKGHRFKSLKKIKSLGEGVGQMHVEEYKSIHISHPAQTSTPNGSKTWTQGHIRHDTLNLTEDKVGIVFECIGTVKDFLNRPYRY